MESEVIAFFEECICDLEGQSGYSSSPCLPDFEVLPRDFVEYAERDLRGGESTHSLINATSNLKRAVDCQLDYILSVLNLDKLYREKRLGVERKLGFLKKAGVFRSRSIEKLNTLRNRLEHHYEIPKIQDVEVYFDLVSAFVSVVEAAIPAFGANSILTMGLVGGGVVETQFKFDGPEIKLTLERDGLNGRIFHVDFSKSRDIISDLDSFSFLMKIHLLLRKVDDCAIGDRHFLAVLKGDI